MTTDAERREATDQWTIQLREQQLRDLRQQLAAATTERDAAVSALRLASDAKGQHTGVYMRLDAYSDLLSQIATLEEQVKALQVRVGALASERDALTREVAGLRYYIGQLERNVSPEERAYAVSVAQMMLAAQEVQP